jgi:hypothetical protein
MMKEYEKLYSEFLTRSIKAEKDKMELQIKLRRVACFQGACLSFTGGIRECISGISQAT